VEARFGRLIENIITVFSWRNRGNLRKLQPVQPVSKSLFEAGIVENEAQC
jgi:hypothetical protein